MDELDNIEPPEKFQPRYYIYVIGQEHGPVKIGVSEIPWQRVKGIQVDCPFKIKLIYAAQADSRESAYFLEKCIHDGFDLEKKRSHGEWFNIDAQEAADEIETAIDSTRFSRTYNYLKKKWCGGDA